MCSICHQVPCARRCPNAPDPPQIYTCDLCGCGIYEGTQYVVIRGDRICTECIDYMPRGELLERLDVGVLTAWED